MTSATMDAAAVDIVSGLGLLPEEFWDHEDDACDCTYQRIGMWTNPYVAETLEVRMCCIWKELYKLFPQFVRVTPAFLDYNRNEWTTTPWEWDGESDMPKAIWYRQMARKEGLTVAEARAKYADRDHLRPRGIPRPEPDPEERETTFLEALTEMVFSMSERLKRLEDSNASND